MRFDFATLKNRLSPAAGASAAGAILLLAGCSEAPASMAEEDELPRRVVRISRAEMRPAEETVYATGSLAPRDRAVLSAKVPGRLLEIPADFGTPVKAGQLLAQIERTDYEIREQQAQAALAQARARLGLSLGGEDDQARPEGTSIAREARAVLEEAAKNRDRVRALRGQGIIAEAEVEAAESSFLVATNRYDLALQEARNRLAVLKERQAGLALAAQQLADTAIRAPFDGIVEARQASPGEFLRQGDPILTVVRVHPIRLRMEVPERDAPRVQLSQAVSMRIEGLDLAQTGKVSRLSPVITQGSRMLIAEADFPNPDGQLRPGSFAKAWIVVNPAREGLFVPEEAVISFAGIKKVFTVEDGRAAEHEIRTGRETGGLIEIESGIEPGETVILNPSGLRDGQPLQVERAGT